MGANLGVSVADYLHTSFPELDREYRNGELVERALPDYLHSITQGLLTAIFVALRKQFSLYACPELRVKLREGVYLIPDLSVYQGVPPAPVPDTPPLVAIEILSPDDRWGAVREKLEEYKEWGVAHVWLVDPHGKRLYHCEGGRGEGALSEVTALALPEFGLEITPSQIFE
jgi:Uma2 family endonuclease